MKKALRSLPASLRFNLSRFGTPIFVGYYRHLYRLDPGHQDGTATLFKIG